jgi:hypothetical protein
MYTKAEMVAFATVVATAVVVIIMDLAVWRAI